MTASGNFSAKLLLGGKSYAFTGVFLGDGSYANQYTISGHTVAVQFNADLAAGKTVGGTVTFDGVSYAVSAERSTFSKSNPATSYEGTYTIYFPPNADNSDPRPAASAGNCWATAAISSAGSVTVKGSLADGTPLSAKGFVAGDGSFSLYESLYKGGGLFAGTLQFAPVADPSISDVTGSVEWSAPAAATKLFPNPFDTTVAATGSVYNMPSDARVLPGLDTNGDASLAFSGGGLAAGFPVKPIVITLKNSGQYAPGYVPVSPEDKLSLSFTAVTGAFSGKFFNGVALVPFSGVVLQKQQEGEGFFLGSDDGGEVVLAP